MKNVFYKLFLTIFIISLIFTSCSKKTIQTVNDDVMVSSTLSNLELAGHTVFVKEGSASFENLSNGKIYIQEENQANTVVFKNCKNLDVIVFSKSNIVLDSTTSINRLELNGNARISHLHNSKKKNQFPVVQKVIVAADITPVLEDCRFMSVEIKENPVKKIESINAVSSEKLSKQNPKLNNSEEKKLTLVQDKTYDGDGVKILISNIPEEAVVLSVFLHDDNQTRQICFMKNTEFGKNAEYFNLGYFTYPFLRAGKSYIFDFVYKLRDDSDDIIEKASISVIPKKGDGLILEPMDKNNLIIDTENLTAYFKEKLVTNIPQNATVTYSVWEPDWTFLGNNTQRKLSDDNAFGPYDFYKDINYSFARKDLKEVKEVMVHFFIEYECFEWKFYSTSVFPFSAQ